METRLKRFGIVGQPGSGKDALAEYLSQKYSLPAISSSDFVREHIRNNNLGNVDRENLQLHANRLRSEHGGDYLVRLAFERAPEGLILTGLRSVDEVTTFKKEGGIIIAVDAPQRTRYDRQKARGRIGDDVTFEAFCAIEEKESHSANPGEQNTIGVMKMANYTIPNNSTFQEFTNKVDDILFALYGEEEFAQKA